MWIQFSFCTVLLAQVPFFNCHNCFLNLVYILVGSTCGRSPSFTPQSILVDKLRRLVVKVKSSETRECTTAMFNANSRRDFLGLALGVSGLFIGSLDANGAGLPPEEKPKLCDDTCEKELENVWWDYIVPFFALLYIFSPFILNIAGTDCCMLLRMHSQSWGCITFCKVNRVWNLGDLKVETSFI